MRDPKVFGPYWNGAKEVFADPFKTQSLLWVKTGGRIGDLISDYNSDNPAAKADATLKLAYAAREAFSLAEVDVDTGEGVTQDLVIELLRTFLAWTNEKK